LANKQYISIIRLFDHCAIPTGNDFNLSRVKKQLQAEFRIARSGFIELEGYTYTRHDVFEEIERPDFEKRLVFHKQLWNSKQILQLLETNVIDLGTVNAEFRSLGQNREFDQFFSPYFAGPFNYLSRTFLSEKRLEEMGDLLAYEDFLQPDEREEAFRVLRVFLDENMRILRNVTGENYKMMRPQFLHWVNTNWHGFFNNLPNEYYDIKCDITSRLINIGVAVQKSHRRDCRRMSDQLIKLQDMPENLSGIIVSNHAVYHGGSRTVSFKWGNGIWVLWIFFMLFKGAAGGCGDSGNSYYKNFNPPIKALVSDSLIKIVKDSIPKMQPDTLLRKK
jgi:hypothetical protein